MQKSVVILIGPPGSGKDTQALYLAQEYGLVQVPSSKIIRDKFAANPDDPIIQREKRVFDSGGLNDAKLVAEWIMEFVRPLATQGKSLVFSGSPRTPHEARVELPELLELYGAHGVHLFYLRLDEAEALRRIAGRRLCVAHKHPIPSTPEFANISVCPQDGSPLERRALDDADKQEKRFAEYREYTEPVLAIAEKLGITVVAIDGSRTIESIHHDIVETMERDRPPISEK